MMNPVFRQSGKQLKSLPKTLWLEEVYLGSETTFHSKKHLQIMGALTYLLGFNTMLEH